MDTIYRPSGNSGGRRLRSSSSVSRFIRCIAPVVSLTNPACMETSRAFRAAVRPAKKIKVKSTWYARHYCRQEVGRSINHSYLIN